MRTTLLFLLVVPVPLLTSACHADFLFTTIESDRGTLPSNFTLIPDPNDPPSTWWRFPQITAADLGNTFEIGRDDVGVHNYQVLNYQLTDGAIGTAFIFAADGNSGSGTIERSFWEGIDTPNFTVTPGFPAPNSVDWFGYHVTRMTLTYHEQLPNNLASYTLEFWGEAGQVPEPGGAWLPVIACGLCCASRHCAILQLPVPPT